MWEQILGSVCGCLSFVCGCFFSDRNYIHMMKANLDALQKTKQELEDDRDDLKVRVAREELDEDRKQLAQVKRWLERVETVISQVNDLLEVRSTETERLCLFGYFSNDCITSYNYGANVLERLEEVKELRRRKGDFKEVTQKILVPKAENTYMIYARSMEISHSDNPKHWTWSSIYEPPNEKAIEIATLNEVYWMELKGNFSTRTLIPETEYEVVFVVKLKAIADGWEEPVNLTMKLIMRDKSEILQEKTLYLEDVCVDDKWVDVKAGDFVAPPKDAPAKIYFTMYQYDVKIQKTGLVVKGVAIRAVK